MPAPTDSSEAVELTYALGAVSRLSGVSPELLRAWERRYGVVEPLRTPGGTRRYRAADLERLRLVKSAVDAGHRIGNIANLANGALRALTRAAEPSGPPLHAVLDALERLDAHAAQRLLSLQLSALGPVRFARDFASPLLNEIGARWADDRLSIGAEHLASAMLRSMLGSALQPTEASLRGPRIAFATPSGERHELGIQIAALCALGAGANPLYLGAEVPVEDLLSALEQADVAALALSIVTLPAAAAERAIAALRGGLSRNVRLWIGGSGAGDVSPIDGVEHLDGLAALEERVSGLGLESLVELAR